MKKRNAFTLIELIAVLAILALIALIVFPVVEDLIDDLKEKAFLRSVEGLEDAATLDYQNDNYEGDRTYQYENGNLILTNVNGISKNENIKVEGVIENGIGNVYVDSEGNVELTVWSEELEKCAKKLVTELEVKLTDTTKENCKIGGKDNALIVQTFTEVMEGKIGSGEVVMDNTPDQNLRYVGTTPNNYVYFNKDAEGNKERWRIIGVFNGQAKIIRDEYYSTSIAWDEKDENGEYLNNWATASLQLALNNTTDGYITTIEANDPDSYGYIDLEHVWNIGASNSSLTRSDFYNAERSETSAGAEGSSHLWTGAIGLMYVSDYGYSTSGATEICDSTTGSNWDTEPNVTECVKNSWLFDSNEKEWTLNPRSDVAYHVFSVYTGGSVGNHYFVSNNLAARPVLYLKSDTKIVGGQGTYDQPFELGV